MGLGGNLQPGNVVASLGFLGEGDKREEVVVVEEPASAEDVEDIKDQVGVDGLESSRGDLGRRHTGDGGGKWKRRRLMNGVVCLVK